MMGKNVAIISLNVNHERNVEEVSRVQARASFHVKSIQMNKIRDALVSHTFFTKGVMVINTQATRHTCRCTCSCLTSCRTVPVDRSSPQIVCP